MLQSCYILQHQAGVHACRYVFSFDIAEALHKLHSQAPLKLMPNEDATLGFWLMGMQLRRIDHPKVRAAAGACCFYS